MLRHCQFYTVRHLIIFIQFAFYLVQNIGQYYIFSTTGLSNEELEIWELLSLLWYFKHWHKKSQLAIIQNTTFRGFVSLVCRWSGLLRPGNGHRTLAGGKALGPPLQKRGRECDSAQFQLLHGTDGARTGPTDERSLVRLPCWLGTTSLVKAAFTVSLKESWEQSGRWRRGTDIPRFWVLKKSRQRRRMERTGAQTTCLREYLLR